jgi:hypothetical protein
MAYAENKATLINLCICNDTCLKWEQALHVTTVERGEEASLSRELILLLQSTRPHIAQLPEEEKLSARRRYSHE